MAAPDTSQQVRKLISEALTARTAPSYHRRVDALMKMGTREVFDASARLLTSKWAKDRKLGADVLSQLGYQSNRRRFKNRSVPLLVNLLLNERESSVKAAAITALARLQARSAIPALVGFAADPSSDVRWAVAAELIWCTWDSGAEHPDPRVTSTLIKLSSDRAGVVRNWACFSLASSDLDTPEIREVFWHHARDRHHDTRMEALRGLARRRDPDVRIPLREAVQAIGWGHLGTWLMDDLIEYANAIDDKALAAVLVG